MPLPNHDQQALSVPAKRYQLIAYIRVDPEDPQPLTYEQALSEQEQQEFMSPENIYRIEQTS